MTCGEARQFIFAFLDNELDSALSLEVQRHIEHCAPCAQECEIESAIRRKLGDQLRATGDVPAFEESALVESLRSPAAHPEFRRKRPRRWSIGVAGAAAAASLLAATLYLANRDASPASASLAEVLVDDFDHFVVGKKPLQIVSGDAEEVSRWLADRTALAVRVPVVDSGAGELRGGRQCRINGKPAAFAVYAIGDALASVVVIQDSDEALSRMKRIERDGHTHWVDRRRGHTVLACRRGELIYAVVSRLPEESLSSLMPPAEG